MKLAVLYLRYVPSTMEDICNQKDLLQQIRLISGTPDIWYPSICCVMNFDMSIHFFSPETVVEVFLQLVEDENKNGESVLIRRNNEPEFIKAPALVL